MDPDQMALGMARIYPGTMKAMPTRDSTEEKRDFAATPEPEGVVGAEDEARFVIQEHHATALHWDHRLERDGVLVSWAVPKGTPPDPRVNHLAVHTEDHPIEYLDFDGEIPEGNYGAGWMRIWDRGTYETEKWSEREAIVVLHGARVSGRYALFQTRRQPVDDPPHGSARGSDPRALPDVFAPQAVKPAAKTPDEDGWVYEPAFGGVRANVAIEGGRVAWAVDEDGAKLESAFPELGRMAEMQDITQMVIEVEIAILGADGRPDPDLVAARRQKGMTRAKALKLLERSPATVVACDLVWFEGHGLLPLAFTDRRGALERLALKGPWWTAASVSDDGAALLAAVAAQGLPGIRGRRGPDDLIAIPTP